LLLMVIAESSRGSLESRVAQIAADCQISGNGTGLLDYYGLKIGNPRAPFDSLQGIRALDIGSGVSDLTATLLSLGADAYALDYGYHDLEGLLARSKYPSSPNPAFIDSFRDNPERYVPGSAHAIPFEAESFDLVTSFHGIFGGVLDRDFDLLQLSASQAVRILRVGGVMMIGPFLGGKVLSPAEKANQIALVEGLNMRGDIEVCESRPRGRHSSIDLLGQLIILKTAA
jgi:hypothetical protein